MLKYQLKCINYPNGSSQMNPAKKKTYNKT